MVLRFPIAFGELSPIVFIQYLTSLAMVEAVRGYGPGYQEMPIRLKWPNDMYASNPEYDNSSGGTTDEPEYLKVGGVIVNTTVIDGEHVLVFGLGINVFNVAPSTSINQILGALNTLRRRKGKAELAPYRIEILLARFAILLEQMLMTFKYQGFKAFEDLYYSRWLHT
jgi:biotin--protein ligase